MRKMKDSGIEWIGQIPSDWNILKLKQLCSMPITDGTHKTPEYADEQDGVPFLSSKDVTSGKIDWANIKYITKDLHKILHKEIAVKKDDVLLAKNGTTGVAAIVDCDKIFDIYVTLAVLRPNKKFVLPNYLLYIVNSAVSKAQFDEHLVGIGVPNLHLNVINGVKAILPPIDEQKKIADFLDGKCADIDQIRADIEKQIDILNDYKKSVITEAVTKGLNPKAKMKDSGIKWVGKIPEHWTLTKIGSVYSLRSEKVSDKVFAPLSVTKNGILPQLESVAKTDDGDNRKLVRKGDFVINSRSDRRGSCGISYLDGSVSLINTVLKPRNEMNPKYYNWLFHTDLFADEFYSWGHGIVDDLWTTRWQEMKNILIPVPPSTEQKNIAAYLDEKCSEIDATIADKQRQLETLEEYKKSLIFEYVTGKKEVPA